MPIRRFMSQLRIREIKDLARKAANFVRARMSEITFRAIFSVVLWLFFPNGISAKDIGIIFLTGISTLIGALYAFRLTERKEKNEERYKRIHALNNAIFLLGRQLNAVQSIRNEIAPYSTPDKRLFGCKAAMPPDYSDLRINFESLSFLLDSADPDLLLRLSVEQDGFYVAMRAISLRAQYYVDHFQSAWAASGIMPGRITQEDARNKIGELVFDSAVHYTDVMFETIDDAAVRLQRVLDELRELSSRLYPGEKFLRFKLKNENFHDDIKSYRM